MEVERMVVGPNNSCLVFQCTFSKTLRGGKANEFCVAAVPGSAVCPVRAFTEYVTQTTNLHGWLWDTDTGHPIFPKINLEGERQKKGVTANAMGARYKRHLEQLFPDDPDGIAALSLHGLRAGGALKEALEGKDLEEIMVKGFWKRPESPALRGVFAGSSGG